MTTHRPRTRPVWALGCLALLGSGAAAAASPAAAELTTNMADCRATVRVIGDNGTDVTVTQDTERFTIDPSGTYHGTGSINGGGQAGQERSFGGQVSIDLPPPLDVLAPASWAWEGVGRRYTSATPTAGRYAFPDWVPHGFSLPLIAVHDEPEGEVCRYLAEVTIAGRFTDSPLSLAAAGGTILFGAAATLAGVARKTRGV